MNRTWFVKETTRMDEERIYLINWKEGDAGIKGKRPRNTARFLPGLRQAPRMGRRNFVKIETNKRRIVCFIESSVVTKYALPAWQRLGVTLHRGAVY